MSELLLKANNIKKFYGDRTVLDIEKLEIFADERIGLVGENGAGKSTLLHILAGIMKPDAGDVKQLSDIAVIRQLGDTDAELSARERSLFSAENERDGLSGGEKTRRRIAGALSRSVPLLFADEPTTDLDADGILTLKKELKAFRGALLLVSHDRALLNELVTSIWYLEDGRVSVFPGTYDAFRAELARRREFQQFEYDQFRREEARLKESARRLREMSTQVKRAPSRMGNSEARLHKREATDAMLRLSHAGNIMNKRIEQLEKKERPRDLPDIRMAQGAFTQVSAKTALEARNIQLSAGEKTLVRNGSFVLPTGSRTALLGSNGCGKTTLLRALNLTEGLPGEIDFKGTLRINPAARPGWFDQNHESTLNGSLSALENALRTAVSDESDVRTTFARLGMRGDSVFKPVSVLSGGERAKTALVKLLVSDVNLLMLDEPTNHLDVFTLEALEEMLKSYLGTLLVVSHDRAFTDAVADRLLIMQGGAIETFEGTLSQREASAHRQADAEKLKLEISTLEMRLAALLQRISSPRKGDRPDQLNSEYEALSAELIAKKRLAQTK